jgi:exodeoxyribonuclease VII large subunit
MQVLVNGNVSIYEARGDYQMIVDYIEESGIGAMQRQFEQLKARLEQQGLFDSRRKKPLPRFAQHIAVITSKTGAAIHDIIEVIQKRQPSLKVSFIAATVQGDGAAPSLIRALEKAQAFHQQEAIDAIIIGRGGGSLEDLWAFNDERLALAIYNCSLPVISAVGHEVDFSICDYVADFRAATPSQAAEIISIEQLQLEQSLDRYESKLQMSCRNHIQRQHKQLLLLRKTLRHPGEKLRHYRIEFNHFEEKLRSHLLQLLNKKQQRLEPLKAVFAPALLSTRLKQDNARLEQYKLALHKNMHSTQRQKGLQLASISAKLELVSPLATLQRGYAIVEDRQGKLIRQTKDVSIGQRVRTRIADGDIDCEVIQINSSKNTQE